MSTAAPRALAIRVRFVEGRFHGEPEWPPSPARLFQALVAAASAPELNVDDAAALRWLEALPPPLIAAPVAKIGHPRKTYVPNNDLDAKGGDPAAVASIRAGKITRPQIFDASTPLLYAWPLTDPASEGPAATVCEIAHSIYQLGRGIDAAHASGSILTTEELDQILAEHSGEVLRPSPEADGRSGRALPLLCPCPGSLARLELRHQANLTRFGSEIRGRKRVITFRQPPKPLFSAFVYDSPPAWALFELRPSMDMGRFAFTAATDVVSLTERLRDTAAERLREAMPTRQTDIERALVGRRVEGLPRLAIDARIRLVPLPSIGSDHADRGIRRLLVEVPSAGPLRADDVFWAFSNLVCPNAHGSEFRVTRSTDHGMTRYYGIDAGGLIWRTETAAALPLRPGPTARSGAERLALEERARNAVRRALRHAGIRSAVDAIRVQREPFHALGSPSPAFANDTRFHEAQLWHVELSFHRHVAGPLIIGNGRFLGLGLLAPVSPDDDGGLILAFDVISGLVESPANVVALALRRAVMARFQATLTRRAVLPPFVSGHEEHGQPTERPHLSFAFDPARPRLLVIAPAGSPRKDLRTLRHALDGFIELRAGAAGLLRVSPAKLDESADPLLAPSRTWVSSTPYVVNRHRKAEDAAGALRADLRVACQDAGLPSPRIEVRDVRGVRGLGLTGHAELHFEVAVPGPILLGRTRHKGGGLFHRPIDP